MYYILRTSVTMNERMVRSMLSLFFGQNQGCAVEVGVGHPGILAKVSVKIKMGQSKSWEKSIVLTTTMSPG